MLDTRSLLSGIHKKLKMCIFRRKFLATTICHLATEIFYLVASWRPYKISDPGRVHLFGLHSDIIKSQNENRGVFRVEDEPEINTFSSLIFVCPMFIIIINFGNLKQRKINWFNKF